MFVAFSTIPSARMAWISKSLLTILPMRILLRHLRRSLDIGTIHRHGLDTYWGSGREVQSQIRRPGTTRIQMTKAHELPR